MKFSKVVLFMLLLPIAALGQEFRATISGTITDPSAAPVVAAKITVTETKTSTKTDTVSDGAGQYVIPFLAPGDYQIEAQSPGFQRFVRQSVHIASGDHPVIDIHLTLGNISQTVTVSAEAPLVNQANDSISQTITTKQVEDLPLNGRTPMMLAALSVGVLITPTPGNVAGTVHPFDNNAAAGWSIGGTASQTSELLMDGSPDTIWSGALAYSPPEDAVQEVSVKAFDNDAAYGHTIGGTLNQVLKTGTNGFHGTLSEFSQVSAFDANTFFNDQQGKPLPVTHFNQYGVTAGGPVLIPKVFDGRNKLFWFFAWENLNDSQPTTDFATVPTDAERNGDFSALLALGPQYQIYNPFSGVQSGKTVNRTAFTNNMIPSTFINSVSQAYLKFFPEPNTAGTATGFDNFVNSSASVDNFDNELGRLDYNMSDRSKMFFDIRHNFRSQVKNNFFSNASTGTTLTRLNWGTTLDEVYTFSPTTILDVRANWTYFGEVHGEPSKGFDPTTLGFPSNVSASSEYLQLPFIGFSGSCGSQTSYQCLGDTGASRVPSQSYQLFTDVVKEIGKHSLKFGFDGRRYNLDAITYGNSAGSYTFGTSWTNGPTSSSSAAPFGQDFAAFLLGLPNSGQYDLNSRSALHEYYYAGFVQDDWRVSHTLTINVGLRFDHDSPYVESMGRTVNGFASTTSNPVAAAAQAAYAKNPIPQIPAGSFNVPGGLTFPRPSDGGVYRTNSHMFSPRVGFAWSPDALGQKTVFRGGVGMFVSPVTVANLAATGVFSSNPILDAEGFSATTSFVPTNNNFLSPASTLTNPFPTGITSPVGSSLGLATFDGQTVSFFAPNIQDPYSIRWNFGVQHAISPNLLVEVDYMGNHGVHLPVATTQLNVIPRQYLSILPTRDQTVINALTASVSNPFAGLLPGSAINGKTTSVSQLVAAFPEYPVGSGSTSTGVIEQNNTIGSSYFESLDARIEKRFSKGLSVIGSYEFSKLIEEDTFLNDTDPTLNRRISPFDHPHHFVGALTYDLPIGRGQLVNLQSGWTNAVLGGWVVNGIYTFQTGAPIFWSNDMVYNGAPIELNPRETNGAAFNRLAFDTNSKDQFQFHIRTFPQTFSNLRQDGINSFDSSILKDFHFSERAYLQLRLEAFNTLNHPTFNAPNVTPTSSSFGVITSQSNLPRQIQLGARIVF